MTSLRWGLLSTARINRALIPAIRAGARSELVAVASRDADRATEYARQWDIPQAFGSYEAMLADPSINAIYISLPNHLHVDWTIKAARAGKHVLCEKPMALDPNDVDRVAEAAKAAGVVVSEAFMYRHHAQTHQILALLDEGVVGELRLVRGCFSFLLTRDDDVRLRPEWGGGSLWDVGCYPVSYARLVMGAEPVAVSGLSERGPTGIDLAFCGALQFPGGRLATFDCGFRAAFRTFMEFVGTEASLEAPNPFKPGPHEHLRLVREGMATTIDVQGAALYSGEVEDLECAALDGRAPAVSLADTRGNVAVLSALYQSAAAKVDIST